MTEFQKDVITVYISIGNSDDKLPQGSWWSFCNELEFLLDNYYVAVHGQWYSLPNSRFQNACWCVEVPTNDVSALREALIDLASEFRQDSIAWAVAETEFLGAK